ncbi:hypothetical protein CHS0354_010644 [Potamilus streckersoni]|uniref:Uncharacterized protein n=1 Tax=Potamilus streckersoni TaxID=2493646 RepID=A0AAE0TC72_9BIVA|nr:hypothetical protein CHS0354_010644 [Potamilus streckersoni]
MKWLDRVCILLIVSVVLLDHLLPTEAKVKQYEYKRYTYKKKRDDRRYKSLKQPCEVNPDCLALPGVQQASCIRKCISATCYEELYGHDEVYITKDIQD